MFNVKETIKLMMAKKGYSLADICEEYNKKTGADFKRETFFYKFSKETIKATEMQVICDILGFEFWLVNRDTQKKAMVVPLMETLKRLFDEKGLSQDAVRRLFVEKTGKSIGQTGFSSKVLKENVKVTELFVIGEILGYDVVVLNPATGLEFNENGDVSVGLDL